MIDKLGRKRLSKWFFMALIVVWIIFGFLLLNESSILDTEADIVHVVIRIMLSTIQGGSSSSMEVEANRIFLSSSRSSFLCNSCCRSYGCCNLFIKQNDSTSILKLQLINRSVPPHVHTTLSVYLLIHSRLNDISIFRHILCQNWPSHTFYIVQGGWAGGMYCLLHKTVMM